MTTTKTKPAAAKPKAPAKGTPKKAAPAKTTPKPAAKPKAPAKGARKAPVQRSASGRGRMPISDSLGAI